jgi:sugar transferase EpsL
MYRRYGKRLFDLVVAVTAGIVFLPVIVIVAILVRYYMGGAVLFRQQRPGLNGKPFYLLKFRTMTSARDANGQLLPDAQRLTAFGRFLRSTSLDELPSLINVIRGDLSLVGPRPLLMHYLDLYTTEQMRRHDVAPGITGWAQVNGRNAISWEDRFAHDLWYVKHYSFRVDLRILFLTVVKVFQRDGITQEGHATVEEFRGSTGTVRAYE